MGNKKSFLFDLNGTVIDDMSFHIKAWHQILINLGSNISLEETKLQCYGKNADLLKRVFPNRFSMEEMDIISIEKEKKYQEEYKPYLKLIEGLDTFLEASYKADIDMAIGSAAIKYNINFVLDGLNLQHYFKAIVSADDVMNSKPDPETFLKCADLLRQNPKDCIVFEDSPKGVESALLANMRCVAITTMHTKEEFESFPNVISIIENYKDKDLQSLLN